MILRHINKFVCYIVKFYYYSRLNIIRLTPPLHTFSVYRFKKLTTTVIISVKVVICKYLLLTYSCEMSQVLFIVM